MKTLVEADRALYCCVRGAAQDEDSIVAVRRFSALGEHAALWVAAGIAGSIIDSRRRSRWASATASIGGAYLLNTAIKAVVRRPRPDIEDLPALMSTPTQLSFPSAHAATSFAAARAFSGGLLPAVPLYAVAGAMAASRVFLGVHYPSDILAGAALGTAIGSLGR